MVARKPGAPGRTRSSRSTIAQGGPGFRLNLWYLPPAFFSAGGPRASVEVRPSLRPHGFRGSHDVSLGRISAARWRTHVPRDAMISVTHSTVVPDKHAEPARRSRTHQRRGSGSEPCHDGGQIGPRPVLARL